MEEAKRRKLWEEYGKKKDAALRETLIIEYAPLVKLVAGRLSIYLGYAVEYDDLVSYGIFGLIDAIDKYDLTKGIKFETYASLRIRGSILDHLRKTDWIPRSVRQKQKQVEAVIAKLEADPNRQVTDEEIAKELNISLDEYHNWQEQTNNTAVASVDEMLEQGMEIRAYDSGRENQSNPEVLYQRQELKEILQQALLSLTEKERTVILLYYYEEMTLKEISMTLEVTESRISQLHVRGLQKMKSILGKDYGILFAN